MPKTQPSQSKKKQKLTKKRKKSQELSNVYTSDDIGGLSNNGGGLGNNEMDCLEELASAQVAGTTTSSNNTASGTSNEINNTNSTINPTSNANAPSPRPQHPPPPGIQQIPNLRIELARHLQTETLSTFLLQSCPGLRMPTFERWLLDSKLEESDRFQSIINEWMDDPSSKLAHTSGKAKKKYGRAAMYRGDNAQQERENSRKEKDCKLLIAAEKRIPAQTAQNRDGGYVGSWIRCIDRDPVLPYQVMETDPSCDRLLKEINAAFLPTADSGDEESDQQQQHLQKAKENVRELCHRTTEACKELQLLEQRLGKYHKFAGWDTSSSTPADRAGKKKKRKRGGGSSGGGGNVHVEWHKEDTTSEMPHICSLIYVHKKRKSSRSSSTSANTGSGTEDNQGEDTSTNQNKPKPFVIKINASHYHKLRVKFDAVYKSSSDTSSMTNEQSTQAFHAILFATVIRYSSLSGGQQLNDWRGGGMQGAVHEGVFDCLSKWFGVGGPLSASGTECFASPFNSTLDRFFSAFPSPDIDGHFGSHGDFFFNPMSNLDFLRPAGGWYELNPPFSPGVMNKMAYRLGELVEISRKQELDVAFIVVIPTVRNIANRNSGDDRAKAKKKKKKKKNNRLNDHEDSSDNTNLMSTVHHAASQSFRQLINSPYCRSHIVLPAREHGYIEGGQHLRPTKYKDSQYSTSVIVLRSKSWKSTDDAGLFEKELREAFASRHAMEVNLRRERSIGKTV
ncbi:hypothetical protein ACHAXR_009617 [Thalassiosira sp. AJA248-18]